MHVTRAIALGNDEGGKERGAISLHDTVAISLTPLDNERGELVEERIGWIVDASRVDERVVDVFFLIFNRWSLEATSDRRDVAF